MRVAIDGFDEVAARTARVLYAEESVTHLGFMQPEMQRLGKRTGPAGDLSGYDVIVSTGHTPVTDITARASVLGVPLVLWREEPELHRGPATTPVAVAANMGSALAPSLVHHPSVAVTDSDVVTLAWTEPGSPYRKGEPITFPEPVGPVWARKRSKGTFVARTSDNWSGAVLTAKGPGGERIVGVADHSGHLEALTLAAVTMVVADGGYISAIQDASSQGGAVLARAMDMELDVAVWRSQE